MNITSRKVIGIYIVTSAVLIIVLVVGMVCTNIVLHHLQQNISMVDRNVQGTDSDVLDLKADVGNICQRNEVGC